MKTCPKCGHITKDDSDEFCTHCGAYYTEKKSANEEYPLGTAMGMATKARAEQEVPVVEGGTLQAGLDHMAAGNFTEGAAQWISLVRENGQPSEEDYRTMVSAMASCIVATANAGMLQSRSGMSDLAMELDGDLMQDITVALVDSISSLKGCEEVRALSSECMYVTLESFNVYPDLRDMLEILDAVPDTMFALKTALCDMDVPQGDNTVAVLDTHADFATVLGDNIRQWVADAGEERMDALADYWSGKANLSYVNIIFQAASLHAQNRMLDSAGRFAKMILKKGFDLHIETINRAYFGVKL